MVLTAVLNSWPTSLLADEQKIAVIPTAHPPSAVGFSVRKAFGSLPVSPFAVPLPLHGFSRDANGCGLHEYSSNACQLPRLYLVLL